MSNNNLTLAGDLTVSGTVTFNGTTTIASPLNLSNTTNTSGTITVTNSQPSTSNATGAIRIPNGGIGIGGQSFFSGTVAINDVSSNSIHTTNIIANTYSNKLRVNADNDTWFGNGSLYNYYDSPLSSIINTTAYGTNSLNTLIQGQNNTAIGTYALEKLNSTNPNYCLGNTAVGTNTLVEGKCNNYCTAIGEHAGSFDISGQYNTYIGAFADQDISANQYFQSTAIGYAATITGSNQIVLGRSTETTIIPGNLIVDGTITNPPSPSDERLKENIEPITEKILPKMPYQPEPARLSELKNRINQHSWQAYDPDRREIWAKMSLI